MEGIIRLGLPFTTNISWAEMGKDRKKRKKINSARVLKFSKQGKRGRPGW